MRRRMKRSKRATTKRKSVTGRRENSKNPASMISASSCISWD